MSDFLDVLARVAQINIESEYYETAKASRKHAHQLKEGNFRLQSDPRYS